MEVDQFQLMTKKNAEIDQVVAKISFLHQYFGTHWHCPSSTNEVWFNFRSFMCEKSFIRYQLTVFPPKKKLHRKLCSRAVHLNIFSWFRISEIHTHRLVIQAVCCLPLHSTVTVVTATIAAAATDVATTVVVVAATNVKMTINGLGLQKPCECQGSSPHSTNFSTVIN